MLHRCVDLTWLPSGKLIVNCFIVGQVFLTGVPSIMNMDVAPVSAIPYSRPFCPKLEIQHDRRRRGVQTLTREEVTI